MMKKLRLVVYVFLWWGSMCGVALCEEAKITVANTTPPAGPPEAPAAAPAVPEKEPQYAGKFFDTRVPLENYFFVKNVTAIFGNKWAPPTDDPKKKEEHIWEQLLLSYEAFRRGITVDQKEVDQEIDRMLAAEKVTFDWKTNKEAYAAWAKEKINAPVEFIENGVRYLLQIEKLRNRIMDSITPEVNEQEARQEFLNEYNTLGVEVVQFDEKKDAETFYRKVKSVPNSWEEEKLKRPKDFRRPGAVSLEFLMDIWKFPKEAVYRMMKMKPGAIHGAEPIYKGWGVFKVLDMRKADEKEFPKHRNAYLEQIKRRKQMDGLGSWIRDLKDQAKIEVYSDVVAQEGKR